MSINSYGLSAKITKILHDEVVDTVTSQNLLASDGHRIDFDTAFTVVNRSLKSTQSLPTEIREFRALKDLSAFLSLAHYNKVLTPSPIHTDLLPSNHPAATHVLGKTAGELAVARLSWFVSDTHLVEELSPLVASAAANTPEMQYALARLAAAGYGEHVGQAIIAATGLPGGNSRWARSLRARLQRRDRKGRFAWMGGGIDTLRRFKDGSVRHMVGRLVGIDKNSETFDIETPDGVVHRVPAGKSEAIKAVIPGGPKNGIADVPAQISAADEKFIVDDNEIQQIDAPAGWMAFGDPESRPDGSVFQTFIDDAQETVVGRITKPDGTRIYSVIDNTRDKSDASRNLGETDSWAGVDDLVDNATPEDVKKEAVAKLLQDEPNLATPEEIQDIIGGNNVPEAAPVPTPIPEPVAEVPAPEAPAAPTPAPAPAAPKDWSQDIQTIPYDTLTYNPETQKTTASSGESQMIELAGRKVVVVEINGVKVPFYLSTGHGGKEDVTAGKWYPIFGVGEDGWLNKLSGAEINDYYGSPELRSVAEWLDATYGDMREDTSVPKVKATGQHIDFINADMNPTENGKPDTRKNLEANIADVKARISQGAAAPEAPTAEAPSAPEAPKGIADQIQEVIDGGETAANTVLKKAKAFIEQGQLLEDGDTPESIAATLNKNADFLETEDNRPDLAKVLRDAADAVVNYKKEHYKAEIPESTVDATVPPTAGNIESSSHLTGSEIDAMLAGEGIGEDYNMDETPAPAEVKPKNAKEAATIAEEIAPKTEEPVQEPALPESAPTLPEEEPQATVAQDEQAIAEEISKPETIQAPQNVAATEYDYSDEPYPPTDEQKSIIDAVMTGEDTVVRALAGTGKTSTLKLISNRMKKESPNKKILYIVFNKSVQEEASKEMPDNVEPRTGDSIAWAGSSDELKKKFKNKDKLILKPNDVADYFGIKDLMIQNEDGSKELLKKHKVVALVKNAINAYSISADDEITLNHFDIPNPPAILLDYANQMWEDINDPNGKSLITLTHMMKIWALTRPDLSKQESGVFTKKDVIFFDEAQDINPVLAKVVADQKFQKVYVGDENQAIYGFRGAEDELQNVEATYDLPLTKSWRFGPQVAGIANRFLTLLGAKYRVEGGGPQGTVYKDGEVMNNADAVLTRTNGGAISAIMQELDKGRTVGVSKAYRDELYSLIDTAAFLKGEGPKPSRLHDDLAMFSSWNEVEDSVKSEESGRKVTMLYNIVESNGISELRSVLGKVQIAKAKGEEDGVTPSLAFDPIAPEDLVLDKSISLPKGVSCLIFEDSGGKIRADLAGKTYDSKDQIKSSGFNWDSKKKVWFKQGDKDSILFAVNNLGTNLAGGEPSKKIDVVVMTAHKSKGLEWDNVRIGNDFWGPKVNKKTGETVMPEPEEMRLAYVAVTRAKKSLDPGALGWVFDYTNEEDELPMSKPSFEEPKVSPEIVEPAAPTQETLPEMPEPVKEKTAFEVAQELRVEAQQAIKNKTDIFGNPLPEGWKAFINSTALQGKYKPSKREALTYSRRIGTIELSGYLDDDGKTVHVAAFNLPEGTLQSSYPSWDAFEADVPKIQDAIAPKTREDLYKALEEGKITPSLNTKALIDSGASGDEILDALKQQPDFENLQAAYKDAQYADIMSQAEKAISARYNKIATALRNIVSPVAKPEPAAELAPEAPQAPVSDTPDMPEPIGAPRKATVFVSDLKAGDVLINDHFVVEKVFSNGESEAKKPGSVWVQGHYAGHESQTTKLWYPSDTREVYRDVVAPEAGDKPALSKPKMKDFGKIYKDAATGEWKLTKSDAEVAYKAAQDQYNADLQASMDLWAAPVDAPSIDFTQEASTVTHGLVFAKDLQAGDIAYDIEEPNAKYGVPSFTSYFIVEEVFIDDTTIEGKISVKGHFPNHASQTKQWNPETPISVVRGASAPAAGELPELHRPQLYKDSKYRDEAGNLTPEGKTQHESDTVEYLKQKTASSTVFQDPNSEYYIASGLTPDVALPEKPKKPKGPKSPAFQGSKMEQILDVVNTPKQMLEALTQHEIIYFDIETSGQNPNFGPDSVPIQIAAHKVKANGVTDTITLFMNPEEPLGTFYYKTDEDSKKLIFDENGNKILDTTVMTPDGQMVSDEWLAQQPSVQEQMQKFFSWLGDSPIIAGHNAAGFDEPILRYIADKYGMDFQYGGLIDTLPLAEAVVSPGKKTPRSLGALAERYGVTLEGWHDATADSIAVKGVLEGLLGEMNEKGVGNETLDFAKSQQDYEVAKTEYAAQLEAHGKAVEAYNNQIFAKMLNGDLAPQPESFDTTPVPSADGIFNDPVVAANPPSDVSQDVPNPKDSVAWITDDENTTLIEVKVRPNDFLVGDFLPTSNGSYYEIMDLQDDPSNPDILLVTRRFIGSDYTDTKSWIRWNLSYTGLRRPVKNENNVPEIPTLENGGAVEGPANVEPSMPDMSPDAGLTPSFNISNWTKVAGQGGSNAGGVYLDENGNKFYVKFPQSEDHARNEALASAFYAEAGIPVGRVMLGKDANGALVLVSPWVNDSENTFGERRHDPAVKADAQKGFAVDAWLLNWDSVGLSYDNMVLVNDQVYRIDPGGSLLYRAQGAKKDSKFLTNSVQEVESMRKMGTAGTVFGDMTDEQITQSVQIVENISPERIQELVDNAFPNDPTAAKQIGDLLIARRKNLVDRFTSPSVVEEPAVPSTGQKKTREPLSKKFVEELGFKQGPDGMLISPDGGTIIDQAPATGTWFVIDENNQVADGFSSQEEALESLDDKNAIDAVDLPSIIEDLITESNTDEVNVDKVVEVLQAENKAKYVKEDPSYIVTQIKAAYPDHKILPNGHLQLTSNIVNVDGVDYEYSMVIVRHPDERFTVYGVETNLSTGEKRYFLDKKGNKRHSYTAIKTKLSDLGSIINSGTPKEDFDNNKYKKNIKSDLGDFDFFDSSSIDINTGLQDQDPQIDIDGLIGYLSDVNIPKTKDNIKDAMLEYIEKLASKNGTAVTEKILAALQTFEGATDELVNEVTQIVKNSVVDKPVIIQGKTIGALLPHVYATGEEAKIGDRVYYTDKNGVVHAGTVHALTPTLATKAPNGKTYVYTDYTRIQFDGESIPRTKVSSKLSLLESAGTSKPGEYKTPPVSAEPTPTPQEVIPQTAQFVTKTVKISEVTSFHTTPDTTTPDMASAQDQGYGYTKGGKKVFALNKETLANITANGTASSVQISDIKVNDIISFSNPDGSGVEVAQVFSVVEDLSNPDYMTISVLDIKADGSVSLEDLYVPSNAKTIVLRVDEPADAYAIKKTTTVDAPTTAEIVTDYVSEVSAAVKSDENVSNVVDHAEIDSVVNAVNDALVAPETESPTQKLDMQYFKDHPEEFIFAPTRWEDLSTGDILEIQTYTNKKTDVYITDTVIDGNYITITGITDSGEPYSNKHWMSGTAKNYITGSYSEKVKVLKHKSQVSVDPSKIVKEVSYKDGKNSKKFENIKQVYPKNIKVGDLIPDGTGDNRYFQQVLQMHVISSRNSYGSINNSYYAVVRVIRQDPSQSGHGDIRLIPINYISKNVKRPIDGVNSGYITPEKAFIPKVDSGKPSKIDTSLMVTEEGVSVFNTVEDLAASGSFDKTTPKFFDMFGAKDYNEYKEAFTTTGLVLKDGSANQKYIIPGIIVKDKITGSAGIVESIDPNLGTANILWMSGEKAGSSGASEGKNLEATKHIFTVEQAGELGAVVDGIFEAKVSEEVKNVQEKKAAAEQAKIEADKAAKEAKALAKANFDKNFQKGSGAEPVVVDTPVDWKVTNFEGVHSLSSALEEVSSSDVSGREGVNVATDSSSVEDGKIKIQKVYSEDGGRKTRITFKLTDWVGNKKVSELLKNPNTSSTETLEISRYVRGLKPAPADVDPWDYKPSDIYVLKETGTTFDVHTQSGDSNIYIPSKSFGKTFSVPIYNSKGELIGTYLLHRANKTDKEVNFQTVSTHGDKPPVIFHNAVEIILNDNVTPEDISDALINAGVDDSRPATYQDIRILAENKILSVFASKPASGARNFAGEERVKALEEIKNKYGVSVDDVEVVPISGGRDFQLLLTKEKGIELAKRANVKFFRHSLNGSSSSSSIAALFDRMANQSGLLSTYERIMNGINIGGMSSKDDITGAGAQGLFTGIYEGTYTEGEKPSSHQKTSGYVWMDAGELLRRLDYHTNAHDSYGKKDDSQVFFDTLIYSPHETIFKYGVSWKDIIYYPVSSDKRQELYEKFVEAGIVEIDGNSVKEMLGL